jgi:hypothetical protein
MRSPFVFESESLGYYPQPEIESEEMEYESEDNELSEEMRLRGRTLPMRPVRFRPRGGPMPVSRRRRIPRPRLRIPLFNAYPGLNVNYLPPEGSDLVKLVQSLLNKVLGTNLDHNGVLGVETRSAIRSYQTQGTPSAAEPQVAPPNGNQPAANGTPQGSTDPDKPPGSDSDKQSEYDEFEFLDPEDEFEYYNTETDEYGY